MQKNTKKIAFHGNPSQDRKTGCELWVIKSLRQTSSSTPALNFNTVLFFLFLSVFSHCPDFWHSFSSLLFNVFSCYPPTDLFLRLPTISNNPLPPSCLQSKSFSKCRLHFLQNTHQPQSKILYFWWNHNFFKRKSQDQVKAKNGKSLPRWIFAVEVVYR